jgi:hypothetical protein
MKLNVPEIPKAYHQRSFLDRLGRIKNTAVAAATGAENATKIKDAYQDGNLIPILFPNNKQHLLK